MSGGACARACVRVRACVICVCVCGVCVHLRARVRVCVYMRVDVCAALAYTHACAARICVDEQHAGALLN